MSSSSEVCTSSTQPCEWRVVHGLRIDFGDDAHHAGDDARFGLGARHAAQARRYEEHPGNLAAAALLEPGSSSSYAPDQLEGYSERNILSCTLLLSKQKSGSCLCCTVCADAAPAFSDVTYQFVAPRACPCSSLSARSGTVYSIFCPCGLHGFEVSIFQLWAFIQQVVCGPVEFS